MTSNIVLVILITSFAMFYDIENPNAFAKDIFDLLDKNGNPL